MTFKVFCQNLALVASSSLIAVAAVACIAEVYYRHAENSTSVTPGCEWIADAVLGFANPPGKTCRHVSLEFDTTYTFNSDGHSSPEFNPDPNACTVMGLGDSHTRAVGVSDGQAWPNLLESMVRPKVPSPFQVINMGVAGYSVGQEYAQMLKFLGKYRPRHVILGLSLATDLYDIRTPANGGFVYGSSFMRPYYDVENNQLVLRDAPRLTAEAASTSSAPKPGIAGQMKSWLSENSAFFRATYRGVIGQYGTRLLRRFGVNPWQNADSVLSRNLTDVDAQSWLIVEKLIEQFKLQLSDRQTGFTLVIIPYLPQVYDAVWNRTFASEPDRYDRFAANKRLLQICARYNLDCLDITEPFIQAARARGRWLHYRQDGHPTPEGQAFIANLVAEHIGNRLAMECKSPTH